MPFNTISVIGLGYIGLPTAAMFASKEKKVIGVDVNQHVVDTINAGKIHIVEPELDVMVKKVVDGGLLKATISPEPADAFLIAVPTPFLPVKTEGSIPEPDLSYIEDAAKSIAKVLKKGDLVILESTSPVGTTEKMANWMAETRPQLSFPQTHGGASDIRVAYCPERVLPGHVVRELVNNDRVVGGMTEVCSAAAIELYKLFVEGECIVTNARTAEMVKLTENASRDVSIAFANELSVICDKINIDVWELIELANRHPRVNILQPGPGVGGHCIAVDPWFIVSSVPQDARLIAMARNINDSKPDWVVEKVKLAIAEILISDPSKSVCDLKIACYGLAFKSNIDDLRESPALLVANKVIDMHAGMVMLVEPNICQLPQSYHGKLLVDFDVASSSADIHVLLVDHDGFKGNVPSSGQIIDTRGIWK
jgi:UDP-N-acetyl-D-mannosaminuronic acid dehydrogenase